MKRFPAFSALSAVIFSLGCMIIPHSAHASTWKNIPPHGFDLQAHRGGAGERTEESLAAFTHGIKAGASTIELDINISRDNVPIVWHDPTLSVEKCRDTSPATVHDPMFPYVGKNIHDLTYAQILTVRCDKKSPGSPQKVVTHNRVATLDQVFALAHSLGAHRLRFNIETKIDPTQPHISASPQEYVDIIFRSIKHSRAFGRVTIESFDWRSLAIIHRRYPHVPLAALWDNTTWKPGTIWSGPISYEQAEGDPVRAAHLLGASYISPQYGTGTHYYLTRDIVEQAHSLDMKVLPWTVDSRAAMEHVIDIGADGFITNFPTAAYSILHSRGISVPSPR